MYTDASILHHKWKWKYNNIGRGTIIIYRFKCIQNNFCRIANIRSGAVWLRYRWSHCLMASINSVQCISISRSLPSCVVVLFPQWFSYSLSGVRLGGAFSAASSFCWCRGYLRHLKRNCLWDNVYWGEPRGNRNQWSSPDFQPKLGRFKI